jgi:hypothetical protein
MSIFPNLKNPSGGNEDCLELSARHNWTWNDAVCKEDDRQFICEKRQVYLYLRNIKKMTS